MREYFEAAWRAYRRLRPAVPPEPPTDLFERFARLRPLVETGWEMPVLVHALLTRSEEHTSELQSLTNLVCRLLLEKKKKKTNNNNRPEKNAEANQPTRYLHARKIAYSYKNRTNDIL